MHLRFLVTLQEHDLDTCNPTNCECTPERCDVETQTGCDGEFSVLQSAYGDKSTDVVCSPSSGENTPSLVETHTHLCVRKLEGGGARSLGCYWERHGWREGKEFVGENKCLSRGSGALLRET